VLALRNHRRQRRCHASLVIGNQNAHAIFAELFMPEAVLVLRLICQPSGVLGYLEQLVVSKSTSQVAQAH
jgi:hypothetical protein